MVDDRKAELLADGFMFLEAPKWHQGLLWVVDVFDHKIYAVSEDGRRERVIDLPGRPGGIGFLSDGALIVASAIDRKVFRIARDQFTEYADLSAHAAGWLNDFAIDADDRVFIGNFGYDFVAGEPRRSTDLHRIDPGGSVVAVAHNVDFPNGSVVINDGRTLIVAETWEGRITAFDLNSTGELSNRRVFADLGDRQPDGLCADAEGAIWAGIYNTGEFVRVREGGQITDRFQFNGSGISCALGGTGNRTLFMTTFIGSEGDMSAGARKSAIFRADVHVPASA